MDVLEVFSRSRHTTRSK